MRRELDRAVARAPAAARYGARAAPERRRRRFRGPPRAGALASGGLGAEGLGRARRVGRARLPVRWRGARGLVPPRCACRPVRAQRASCRASAALPPAASRGSGAGATSGGRPTSAASGGGGPGSSSAGRTRSASSAASSDAAALEQRRPADPHPRHGESRARRLRRLPPGLSPAPGGLLLRRGVEDPGVDAPALPPAHRGHHRDVEDFDHGLDAAHRDRDQRADGEALPRAPRP